MGKAIDPFEEYLRKKKVELLERKYREPSADGSSSSLRPVGIPPDEDPEVDARLREEAKDFLQSGQSAGMQAFQNAQDIGEDEVLEIKDALDDVFEQDVPVPQTVDQSDDAGDTFVNFFKQVQEEYDERPVCDNVACLPPDPGSQEVAPGADIDVMMPADLRGAAVEVAFDEADPELPERGTSDTRLDLEAILVDGAQRQDLAKRVDVLCRIVAKLCERFGLPESEIIEALIKGGLEF
ncbi:MAG TPA: hypothetical protein VFY93_07970 [Planctomycetota bacterium]|nr:hypothetical protein [Planctomycetota bacterium]